MKGYTHSKPPKSYWNITHLTEVLLHHCETHGITCWAEFGSLIGLLRHGGAVIPWDYDGDYGIFAKDKERFLETIQASKPDDVVVDVGYYKDEGCLALHPVGNEDDIVDVIFYEVTDTTVNSLQNEVTKRVYPGNDDYCYNKSDFFPLSKRLMLGHFVYMPNEYQRILSIHYADWTQFPEKFQNWIAPKYLDSPFKPIPKHSVHTFSELKPMIEVSKEPFILKKTNLLSCDKAKFEELVRNQQSKIFGYSSSITWDKQENDAATVWEMYQAGKLPFNIVDSPVDDKQVLSSEWNEYANSKLGSKSEYALTWIMTNSPKVTHFHIDPNYAGGFMKVLEGEKIWWCIAPSDYEFLKDKGYTIEQLVKLNMPQLLELEDGFLFGKIMTDVVEDGDLIWFPINTLHKVITTKNSYGLGGYL